MKKIISFALAVLMLASMLVITANAKDPYGTVVEAQYTKTAPDMKDGLPDASWGEKVIHVDKNTKNAGITDYSLNHDNTGVKADQNMSFDAYMRWTDDTLYLCFTSPDTYIHGDTAPMRGDGFQITAIYGIMDISHCSSQLMSSRYDTQGLDYDFLISFFIDDYSVDTMNGADYIDVSLYWDEKTQTKVGKFAIPFTQIGLSKKETPKDGDYISFSMICVGAEPGDGTGYTGWLEWGDFFSAEKGFDPSDELFYVPQSMNPKTTTANTIKLVGKNSGGTTPETPTTPTTPTTPAEEPSSWAKDEVNKAIAAGLVPDALQKDYTKGISRENLSKILSALLDKVYGKAPATTTAKFNDTTDADVLKAANLGIINGYKADDGSFNFKPANTLKRSEMSAIVNRVAKLCGKTTTGFDSEVKFADTANHWCKSELGWPVHVGIVKGTSDTTFSPENTLTTEQTIMMIYRAYEALK